MTREWKGERFPDGRPRVPDELLGQLKTVDAEEAWAVLKGKGYPNQFEGGWRSINAGPRLVGRVVTAVFMPLRPDINGVINERGKAEGRSGAQNSWVIDTLKPGDILVVDLFGKIKDGTFAGDNLSTSIYTKSHTGLIVDGSVRDETGISEIHGFQVLRARRRSLGARKRHADGNQCSHPIGQVTVMPGDVAVTDPEGIIFIPPQLCEEVASQAELTHLIDDWGHRMLREQKYTPGEIDGRWTKQMIDEFNQWAASRGSKQRLSEH